MAVVLIVEDDPALCDLMRQVLEEEGHRTVIANSLDEAKRAACNEPIELVLADLLEFELRSGAGSVQALRLLAAGRPVLLCTGQADAGDLADMPGLAGVLGKPFDIEDLLGSVAAALRSNGEASRASPG